MFTVYIKVLIHIDDSCPFDEVLTLLLAIILVQFISKKYAQLVKKKRRIK